MATGLPDSTTIEIEFTDGVWTDVTSLVNVGSGAITRNQRRGNPNLSLRKWNLRNCKKKQRKLLRK